MSKYKVIHSHTMLSNGVTNIDSVTDFHDYINEIVNNKNLNIDGICFTEHGSIFEWYKKKCELEDKGMKYVHGIEAYVTETLNEKIRDNYHVCLYAKNFEGFKELNRLISKSFNREDNHYYYSPRILFDDLLNTSDNIIISTACLGGIIGKGNKDIKLKFLEWMSKHNDRCFLEVQHHQVKNQDESTDRTGKVHLRFR